MIDPQILGPLCGLGSSLCVLAVKALGAWRADRREQRIMAATPEQLAALSQTKATRLAASGTAAGLLLGLGLSIGLPFATGQAHPIATLQRLGVISAADPAAQKPPTCDRTTCKPPGECTTAGCVGNAEPAEPSPTAPAPAQPPNSPQVNQRGPRLDTALAWDNCRIYQVSPSSRLPEFAQ